MKTIHINSQKNVSFTLFPDNQPHVNVTGIEKDDNVAIVCAITSSLTLMHLVLAANAVKHIGAKNQLLVIPYLMAARSDRVMLPGDSLDLQVVADIINTCEFKKVVIIEAHSHESFKFIHNSIGISIKELVQSYDKENAVLICPDKGARIHTEDRLELNDNLKEVVMCNKSRDLATGRITLTVENPEACEGRNCIIIDDLCDGGGTFLAIADQIKPAHLTLMVTHGIFSKGFEVFKGKFDSIITTNTYGEVYNHPLVKTINIFDLI